MIRIKTKNAEYIEYETADGRIALIGDSIGVECRQSEKDTKDWQCKAFYLDSRADVVTNFSCLQFPDLAWDLAQGAAKNIDRRFRNLAAAAFAVDTDGFSEPDREIH